VLTVATSSVKHPAVQDDSSALPTHLLCLFYRHVAQRSAIALFRWLQLGLGTRCRRKSVRAASSIVSFRREL